MNTSHIPVLLNEICDGLALKPNENVIDCTVGAGGHAEKFLESTAPNGKLLGFDLDEVALEAARRNLERFSSRVILVHENYKHVENIILSHSFGPVHAALLDLGFSSMEIDDPSRGFSFRFDGPLDMRYDRAQEVSAASIINSWSVDELAKIFWEYGEERFARRIAERIIQNRRRDKILGTLQLVDLIGGAVPANYRHGKIHFATRVFQALRIATNDELGSVAAVLPSLFNILAPGGRLAVISFHSLEDRIVKHFFQEQAKKSKLILTTKKPVTASETELDDNSRARSAKLRIAIKI